MPQRVNQIYYKETIENRSNSKDLLFKAGDFVIVKRGIPRLLILRCPCGCGDDLLINLDKRSGKAWRLYSRFESFSLFPSYWRDTACGSHFIIWENRIYWCYRTNELDEGWRVNERIENKVLEVLKENEYRHYIELADECGLIPWECLQACKQLSRKGLCISKNGVSKEQFKKSTSKIQ